MSPKYSLAMKLPIFNDSLITVISKHGYALKNGVEGLSDEAYYPGPGSHQKKLTKIGQPYNRHQTKKVLISNHRKQAKIEFFKNFFHH